jgi:hypothetical protein
MKPKERKLILEKIKEIFAYFKSYPEAAIVMDDYIQPLKKYYKELLYEEVDKKDHGLTLNPKKRRDIGEFALHINEFKDDFKGEINVAKNTTIPVKAIKDSELGSKLVANNLFKKVSDNVSQCIVNLSGEEITKAEFRDIFVKEAIDKSYAMVDAKLIDDCTNIQAIKKMDIEIIDDFIADYQKKYKDGNYVMPNFKPFIKELDAIFEKNAVITQSDFEKEVLKYLKSLSKKVKDLKSDEFAKAEIFINKLINNLNSQITGFTRFAFIKIAGLLIELIKNLNVENKNFSEICVELSKEILNIKVPVISLSERIEITNLDVSIENILKQNIKIDVALKNSVNLNSTIYVINLPSFIKDVTGKINNWKLEVVNAIEAQAQTLIQFDGCSLSAKDFKSEVLSRITLDSVKEIVRNGLNELQDLELDTKEDINIEPWNTVWKSTFNSINAQSIYDEMKDNPEELKSFALNVYEKLGTVQGFEFCVVKCIFAIEKAGEEDREKIMHKVDEVKKTVEQVGNRLLFIEKCKNNAEMAKKLPEGIKPVFRAIADEFKRATSNYKVAKVKLDAMTKGCNDMNKVNEETCKLFADFMYGSVIDLFIKATEIDKVPLIGKYVGDLGDMVKDELTDFTLEMNGTILPDITSELDEMAKYNDLAAGYKLQVISFGNKIAETVDGYVSYMQNEVHSQTSLLMNDSFGDVGYEELNQKNDGFRELTTDIDSLTKALEVLLSKVQDITEEINDTKLVASFIKKNRSMFFSSGKGSWHNGYNFNVLYSEVFIDNIAPYINENASQIRKEIPPVDGVFDNVWEGAKNFWSALKKVFTHEPDKHIKYMTGIIGKILKFGDDNSINFK